MARNASGQTLRFTPVRDAIYSGESGWTGCDPIKTDEIARDRVGQIGPIINLARVKAKTALVATASKRELFNSRVSIVEPRTMKREEAMSGLTDTVVVVTGAMSSTWLSRGVLEIHPPGIILPINSECSRIRTSGMRQLPTPRLYLFIPTGRTRVPLYVPR